MVAVHRGIGHEEEGDDAVEKGGGGAERDEGIHIGRPPPEALKSAHEEALIDDHDDGGEEELHESHGDMIFGEEGGHPPTPHHVPHGEIHEDEEEEEGDEEARKEPRCLAVFEFFLGRSLFRVLRRGIVSRCPDGGDDFGGGSRPLDAQGICEQADRAGGHARDFGDRLFHMRTSRRTAHSRDIIEIHIAILLPFEKNRRAAPVIS